MTHVLSKSTRARFPTYSIRTLICLITVIALGIVCFQAWTCRIIQGGVISNTYPIKVFEPYASEIASASEVIEELTVDVSMNMLIVTAQARNMDAAKREIQALMADEDLFFSASKLQLTLAEVRYLRKEMTP